MAIYLKYLPDKTYQTHKGVFELYNYTYNNMPTTNIKAIICYDKTRLQSIKLQTKIDKLLEHYLNSIRILFS